MGASPLTSTAPSRIRRSAFEREPIAGTTEMAWSMRLPTMGSAISRIIAALRVGGELLAMRRLRFRCAWLLEQLREDHEPHARADADVCDVEGGKAGEVDEVGDVPQAHPVDEVADRATSDRPAPQRHEGMRFRQS